MHCCLYIRMQADSICRERWSTRVLLKAGRGTLFWPGLEYYVETRCWEMFSSWSRGPLWCGTYINVICTVASAGGRAGTEAQLLALGRWRVQWGQSYPPPLLSALCQRSFSANMSETCRRQLFVAVLLCHCVTCSLHSTCQTCCVCIQCLMLGDNIFVP